TAREVRVEQVLGADRVGRVRLHLARVPPRSRRVRLVSPPVEGDSVLELDERAARPPRGELLQPGEACRPIREGSADLRLDRVVAAEDRSGLPRVPAVVEAG